MPALERDRWTWQRPSPSASPMSQWYQVEDRIAAGIWAGKSYVFGRAVTYDVPAGRDGHEYWHGQLAWHPDHPPVLTDGHDGDVVGTAVWSADSDRDGGLYVLFEIPDEHLTPVVVAAMSGAADLSIRHRRPSPSSMSSVSGLEHIALVPAGDVPGATVLTVATPWDVYIRDGYDDLVHAGEGPAAFAPLPSASEILARLGADRPGAGELVATRTASGLFVPLERLELRYAHGTGRPTLSGLAVPYDRVTRKTGGARPEVFRFGALTNATRDPARVRLRDENHAKDRRPAGVAVKLVERREGLYGVFRFHDTPEGRSAFENAREGTYGGLSVGFVATRERTTDDGVREILGADLDHVSLVDEPAYADAQILGVTPADVAPRTHAPAMAAT